MMLHLKAVLLATFLVLQLFTAAFSWDYIQQKSWSDQCISGTRQSPINLPNSGIPCTRHNIFSLSFKESSELHLHLTNNAWTAVSDHPIAYLIAQDISGIVQKYESNLFTIHSLSEHAMSSQRYDVELQIIFELSKETPNHSHDSKAVVSILFQNDPTKFDSNLISEVNDIIGSSQEARNITLQLNTILGKSLNNHADFFVYKGSNTVPPCDEDVNWYVLESPLKISERDLQFIKNTYFDESKGYALQNGNARDLQDLNSRIIQRLCDIIDHKDQPIIYNGTLLVGLLLILSYLVLYFTYGKKSASQEDQDNPFTGNNLWTLHPLYSIINVPSKDGYSRRSRISILFIEWLTQLATATLWYSTYRYTTSIDVLTAAILSIISTIPISFVLGLFFRRYYRRAREISSKMNSDVSFFRGEKFAFLAVCMGVSFIDLFIIYSLLDYLIGKLSRYSVYSFFAAILLEECIFEPSLIYLATKFNAILPILKLRGYYFEGEITHYNIIDK